MEEKKKKITREELNEVFLGTPRLDHPGRISYSVKNIEQKTYKVGHSLNEDGEKIQVKYGTFYPNPLNCKGVRNTYA